MLENEGIDKREVFSETPVRIEYSLTDKGQSLKPLMDEIENWSQQWLQEQMNNLSVKNILKKDTLGNSPLYILFNMLEFMIG